MGRFLAGVVSALLLVAGGLFLWRSVNAAGPSPIPKPPVSLASLSAPSALDEPPSATEKTREEKRFSRYDHDRDGKVSRDEYLAARHKAFAKLDTNGDGRLSFDEYAVKTTDRFAKADADKSGGLDAAEFATTRVQRRTAARANCPPQQTASKADDDES